MFGDYAIKFVVEFDEVIIDLQQLTGLEVPFDVMPPAQRNSLPGQGCLQHVGVQIQILEPGCNFRTFDNPEPVIP